MTSRELLVDFKILSQSIVLTGCLLSCISTFADNTLPLPFAIEQNKIIKNPIEIDYEIDEAKKDSLKIGPFVFSDKTFAIILREPKALSPNIQDYQKKAFDKKSLFMAFPPFFYGNIKLELISKSGFVLWKKDISQADIAEWAQLKRKIKEDSTDKKNTVLDQFRAVLWDVRSLGLKIDDIKDSFRFCLSTDKDKMQMSACTSYYGVKKTNGNSTFARVKTMAHARVLAQGEVQKLHGVVNVGLNETASFYAELQTGETFQFVTPLKSIPLLDVVRKKEGSFRVIFSDLQPYSPAELLNKEDTDSLVTKVGFNSTIGDFRKFWSVEVLDSEPIVYLPGEAGGIFKVTFLKDAIPSDEIRPKVEENTLRGTYGAVHEIYGKKFKDSKLSSKEESLKTLSESEELFMWNFKADQKGVLNKSYLTVESKGQVYRNYFEIYRGYSNELSSRLSAILTPNNFVFNGELAYNHWFDDVFGWSNSILSRQRWGFSYKYFQSITNSKSSEATNFTMSAMDIKYRFSAGLWGRDESFGMIASLQDMTYGIAKSRAIGYGAFWARSMPQVFDRLFNYIPWFRYQKWVDMELILYPTSLLSTTQIERNYALNFHGKILWTENFFGEAGFGRKEFIYSDTIALSQARMETFYGTFGVGVNF